MNSCTVAPLLRGADDGPLIVTCLEIVIDRTSHGSLKHILDKLQTYANILRPIRLHSGALWRAPRGPLESPQGPFGLYVIN